MKRQAVSIAALLGALVVLGTQAIAEPFAIRGIKGLWWEGIEKYRLALPWLAEHDLNFLMLCYSSFPASGRDWRSDYTDAETKQFRELAAEARRLNVSLCLSFNPGIWSNPPLEHSSETDYELALGKVRKAHSLGINWFALCLDDINRTLTPKDKEKFETLEAAQAYFVNRLWDDMKDLSPRPKLIFCPSAYTTGDAEQHQDYIRLIGRELDREIMVFWTGPEVCSKTITAADARQFGEWIGRKPFVWDNYPVNDMFPWRPLLAPLKGRAADLPGHVAGYMSNPMKQWHASTLPLSTLADYLNAPESYNPAASLERAIRSFPESQHTAIRQLMALYGSSFWGDPGFPPKPAPQTREDAVAALPAYRELRDLMSSDPEMMNLWADVGETVEADIALLERKARNRLQDSPLKAQGDEFDGGAGDLFGFLKNGVAVNYIYAKSSGRNTMSTQMRIDQVPPKGMLLRLTAMNDDHGNHPMIEIALNDTVVLKGASPFTSAGFETRKWPLKASALKQGINLLTITCLEEGTRLGMPPWFMVAEAELASADPT